LAVRAKAKAVKAKTVDFKIRKDGKKWTRPRRGAVALHRINKHFPNVDTVLDQTKHVKIHVTEQDCTGAHKESFSDCALARAAKRELHADGALIGLTYSYIIRGRNALRFKTPPSVQREILSFDRHHDFDIGTYSLSPIPEVARLGVSTNSKSGPRTGPSKTPRYHVHKSARVRKVH
jgi:hypothetical protein